MLEISLIFSCFSPFVVQTKYDNHNKISNKNSGVLSEVKFDFLCMRPFQVNICDPKQEDHDTFTEIEDCPFNLCPFGSFSDHSVCSYQTSCCQTLHVQSNRHGLKFYYLLPFYLCFSTWSNLKFKSKKSIYNVEGYYSRVYLDDWPHATYKLVSKTLNPRFIHFSRHKVSECVILLKKFVYVILIKYSDYK